MIEQLRRTCANFPNRRLAQALRRAALASWHSSDKHACGAAVNGLSIARSGFTVLVVEDNDRIRNSEAEALASCGYDVLTAINADVALQLLPQSPIDLVITDVRLPGGMDGIALSRAVKKHWPDVKVMIVGADVDQFSSEDLHPIVDDRLKKPFKLSELQGRVAKLLDPKGAAK